MTEDAATAPATRRCGECSLCCTVLRVEALAKPGGIACPHLAEPGRGCAIHLHRPAICRSYRCLWLQGGLEAGDRPDRLGAIVDLVAAGDSMQLHIREASPGASGRSARLREIAARFRQTMPVRISDAEDPLDPDRPWRMLLPSGEEHRGRGDRFEVVRADGGIEQRRRPLFERAARRVAIAVQAWRWRRRLRGPMGVASKGVEASTRSAQGYAARPTEVDDQGG